MKTYINALAIIALILSSCEGNSDGSAASATGKGGSMARFTISGNYLYTVANTPGGWESELNTYDITNEKQPQKVGSKKISTFVETIFPTDSLLFFGTRTGMLIYSIKNPVNPRFVSEYEHIYSCDPVVVQKNRAYVTLNSESNWCGRNNNRLDIIDLSNIYRPQLIAQYPMSSPRGLGIDGYTLFVCDDGLKVYDIGENSDLTLIDKFQVDGYDVIPNNGLLLMIGEEGFYQYKYNENSVDFVSSITTN